MRENRTYGSEGGGAGQPALPTPIHQIGQLPDRVQHSMNPEQKRKSLS